MSQADSPTDWSEKKSSNKCPDISGIYFDRVSNRDNDDIEEIKTEEKSVAEYLCKGGSGYGRDWMKADCSLMHWLIPSSKECIQANRIKNCFLVKRKSAQACPERRIELSQAGSESIEVKIYQKDKDVEKYTIDILSAGYRCEDGKITYINKKGSHKKVKTIIYPSVDSSLIIKSNSLHAVGIPIPPIGIPAGYATTMNLYKWDRVGVRGSPYENCHSRRPLK